MALFPDPPTFAEVSIKDSTGQEIFNPLWLNWFLELAQTISGLQGVTATITIAKLTPSGSNGSLTFTNGILTSYVGAT